MHPLNLYYFFQRSSNQVLVSFWDLTLKGSLHLECMHCPLACVVLLKPLTSLRGTSLPCGSPLGNRSLQGLSAGATVPFPIIPCPWTGQQFAGLCWWQISVVCRLVLVLGHGRNPFVLGSSCKNSFFSFWGSWIFWVIMTRRNFHSSLLFSALCATCSWIRSEFMVS